MSEKAPKAVVLLSGGLDSTTALAIAKAEGYETVITATYPNARKYCWKNSTGPPLARSA